MVPAGVLGGGLNGGRFDVGYRTIEVVDVGRSVQQTDTGTVPRTFELHVWYPAGPGGEAMVLRDYFSPTANGAYPTDTVAGFKAADPLEQGEAIEDLLAAPVRSRRGAPPIAGKHHLILYAHTETFRRSVLAEYLASYGYVVAAPRVMGTWTPELDVALSGIETQVQDLQASLRQLLALGFPIESRFAVVGVSFGALSGLSMAMRDPRVAALVSLDGGIGSTSNIEGFGFQQSPFHLITRATAPILHAYGINVPGTDLAYLHSLEYASRTLVGFEHLEHADFGGDALLAARKGAPADRVLDSYRCVASWALSFLDLHLKNRSTPPDCAGAGRPSVEAQLVGKPGPPGIEELGALLETNGS